MWDVLRVISTTADQKQLAQPVRTISKNTAVP
jgi:hypothetical protein